MRKRWLDIWNGSRVETKTGVVTNPLDPTQYSGLFKVGIRPAETVKWTFLEAGGLIDQRIVPNGV